MKTESLFGFLAGATLGALAGILFAPATGDETRKKIMDAASEGYDEAVEGAQVLGHKAHVRYRYARREMNALKKTLMEQGGELKEEVRQAIMEKLDKLEKSLSREEGIDEQPEEA
ncbi:MAG: YtxH domain-containing protein [Bacteroidales bacterium]|jgi:gas vesicle protein|nr:YtxH domain-containing protein [Bacteroidales bacterium]